MHYRNQGYPTAQAARLVRDARVEARSRHQGMPPDQARAAIATIGAALETFDETPADLVLERLLGLFTPCVVLTDVVLPYLRDLGDRWACDRATVAQEHFASRFLESRILHMGRGWGRGAGPRAVLACLPGEQHTLGLLACGIALRDAGWRVIYLGADTPVAAAGETAGVVQADAIVLAATVPHRLGEAAGEIATLAAQRTLAIGGAAVGPDSATRTGALVLPPDPLHAALALTTAGTPTVA